MNKQISLIIPTYDRYEEVGKLLETLKNQDCNKDDFEVIIVDQNDKIDLAPITSLYLNELNLTHYKTPVKGIANAKNKGIELSSAPIITFPDDDCTYYPNTITIALNFLKSHPDADVVYGRLYDRDTRKNIMRNWPLVEKQVTIFNFHYTYSAITAFIRKNAIRFDTNFGVGSSYGVGEELDYLLQTFKLKLNSTYTPLIDIWHPQINPDVMPPEKVYYYAKGYGAICKKHLSFIMFFTFLMSNLFQILQIVKSLLLFNNKFAYKRWLALKGRIVGFNNFK
jgi:glycosyltransferase involved in cell wall biosynthesis